jgi:hypothetical protein
MLSILSIGNRRARASTIGGPAINRQDELIAGPAINRKLVASNSVDLQISGKEASGMHEQESGRLAREAGRRHTRPFGDSALAGHYWPPIRRSIGLGLGVVR